MPLSDVKVRSAKPDAKPFTLADEKGLYLLVNGAGKYWRFDYRYGGKGQTPALSVYPEIGLKSAGEKRDAARLKLADGVDPNEERKATNTAMPTSHGCAVFSTTTIMRVSRYQHSR